MGPSVWAQRSLVVALALTCLAISACFGSEAAARCISSPGEYRSAWQQREVRCVSPSLFGTTYDRGATSIYPSGFWYAWAGSNTNLERYLELRSRYAAEPPKVGIGILSFVGDPELSTSSTPTDLAVYTLPDGVEPVVPTFEAWFRLLENEFGATAAYPLAAQIELVRAYSQQRRDEDVVDAFAAVTGCRRGALLRGRDPSARIGCNDAFLGAVRAAGPSPYGTGHSKSCFRRFASRYGGPRNAAALRGALFQCQDAGFLNSGVGLGYNTFANPFVCKPAHEQSVRQRYTGREFVLPNMRFDALPSHVDIPLELGRSSERDFLEDGYC